MTKKQISILAAVVVIVVGSGLLAWGWQQNWFESDGVSVEEKPDSEQTYADGTYTAMGEYNTPQGQVETIKVKVTLQDDAITKVDVTPQAEDEQVRQQQEEFAQKVEERVAGKQLDKVELESEGNNVALGFNWAIDNGIKQEARK
jgi:uncharacterized protein with FMN-binding domain